MTDAEALRRAAELLRRNYDPATDTINAESVYLAAKLEKMAEQKPVAWMYYHEYSSAPPVLSPVHRPPDNGIGWTETPLYVGPVEIPREPTITMIDAAIGAHFACSLPKIQDKIGAMWIAMWDAALAAEQKT